MTETQLVQMTLAEAADFFERYRFLPFGLPDDVRAACEQLLRKLGTTSIDRFVAAMRDLARS